MSFQPAPKAACIHDLSCFGRCSLAVIAPILSAMGVCCCPLPAAVFSTHTGGFSDMAIEDLTAYLPNAIRHWESLGLGFEAIYTGFLANADQYAVVEDFIARFGGGALILVDPVMGDDGTLYKTYNDAMCRRAALLCRHADIITPNLTEACILAGKPYPGDTLSPGCAERLARELTGIGPSRCIITGVTLDDGRYGAASYDRITDRYFFAAAEKVQPSYPGTGDIFASVLLGSLLRGDLLETGCRLAADFIYACCLHTKQCGTPVRNGVEFEPLLGRLTARD